MGKRKLVASGVTGLLKGWKPMRGETVESITSPGPKNIFFYDFDNLKIIFRLKDKVFNNVIRAIS